MLRNSEEIRKSSLFPPNLRWLVALGITSVMGMGAGVVYVTRPKTSPTPVVSTQVSPPVTPKINALGRLSPAGEVVRISAPTDPSGGSRVAQLLVDEGQQVRAGDVIAILDNRDRLQANLKEAQQQVRVARSRLDQVRAGAKQGEISAREATVRNLQAQLDGEIQTQEATNARLEAELQNAEMEFRRYESLYQEGAIAASALDTRRLTVKTAEEELNGAKASLGRTQRTLTAQIQEAKATLEQTAEVRPTDVAIAQAEVDSAIATVAKMQVELDVAYIRAPQAGQILRVQARPGETIGEEGIVELGETDQMYAIAEIYESDIAKIRPGQTAIITSSSNAFKGELSGTVDRIGLKVAKKDVLDSDPTAATDARVIEAKIRLDEASSQQVANFTNLQVNVEIVISP
ncbi:MULTISPECIES: ABC exporter membrane fusion protein [unclassified Nodularia (in: cyanobacteria)]|uniref:ABC exporter membrane fusion protein n=1 Tax=unclassified Nodularia (in: cyanobacteria) TaxID=2656917 RepID=UPI001881908B|nr:MULTISPECIES: ABC exporter membrane fusion protein [unclassified Nodularia (in: cyanobacteria)]MBE9201489.1 ABC exporter membrane fusion protein [Nodularia sp. LEGE 06071]MCC2691427.1 ABC exporter membrane fusion protein [Nodularia sp. LEGE 04288]